MRRVGRVEAELGPPKRRDLAKDARFGDLGAGFHGGVDTTRLPAGGRHSWLRECSAFCTVRARPSVSPRSADCARLCSLPHGSLDRAFLRSRLFHNYRPVGL